MRSGIQSFNNSQNNMQALNIIKWHLKAKNIFLVNNRVILYISLDFLCLQAFMAKPEHTCMYLSVANRFPFI